MSNPIRHGSECREGLGLAVDFELGTELSSAVTLERFCIH